MHIVEVDRDVSLVDLQMKMEGFRKFISSWIVKDKGKALVVDVGPAATVPKLVEAIKFLKIEKVEFVLLTHIHLDHAGGVGHFLEIFPEASVVVHEKGLKHIIDPEKLWKSSLEVLGEYAKAYGKPKPVDKEKIFEGDILFAGKIVEIIDTPGHAPHHQSYFYGDLLFSGEALGVHFPMKNDFYLRPATPPKFFYDTAYSTIEKIEKLPSCKVCFGHFGFNKDSKEIAKESKRQIKLWVETVYDVAFRRDFRSEEEIIETAKKELLKKDQRFARYHLLDDDVKRREDFFIKNSLKGILDFVYENYRLK
ncbi:MAG: MBL fold metallo-hydrolase [Archaeoglobaceae archaeon]|nr:MBL fold metallo-hydrolase [Archaeoglobaceae archaeon]MCX8151867.1 MBL fold metallo-hydrolase [Archaeoglobaceae archaeon]MDW8014301.1 MBL fold metallo-hydrolase [Archaeoglobaceae archaeon]